MWYTVFITLVIDAGGLLLIYALLRDRVRRATSAAAQIAELRDEVSRLVVEMNQTTERNVALIEDRISGLNDLLAAADKKIGLLHREIEKHDVGAQVYTRLVEGRQQAPQPREQPSQPREQAVQPREQTRGQPAQPQEQAPPLSVELSEKSGRSAGLSQRKELHQRVVMLSRSGFSAALIAGRVGIPLGEVELIISLERQRMSQVTPQGNEGQT